MFKEDGGGIRSSGEDEGPSDYSPSRKGSFRQSIALFGEEQKRRCLYTRVWLRSNSISGFKTKSHWLLATNNTGKTIVSLLVRRSSSTAFQQRGCRHRQAKGRRRRILVDFGLHASRGVGRTAPWIVTESFSRSQAKESEPRLGDLTSPQPKKNLRLDFGWKSSDRPLFLWS